MSEPIPWGLKSAVPQEATLAWGARAIYRDGFIDIVHDRQGFIGDVDAKTIKAFLQEVQEALVFVKKRALEWYKINPYKIDPGFAEDHILFDSETLRIVGNTKASYGYLYLAAWRKA